MAKQPPSNGAAKTADEQEQAQEPDTGGDTDEEIGESVPASDPPANY